MLGEKVKMDSGELYVVFNGYKYLFKDVEFEVAGKKFTKNGKANLEECLRLGCVRQEATNEPDRVFSGD